MSTKSRAPRPVPVPVPLVDRPNPEPTTEPLRPPKFASYGRRTWWEARLERQKKEAKGG